MLEEWKAVSKVAGGKQVRRALKEGRASLVLAASDADPNVTGPILSLCAELGIPAEEVPSMKELGRACGISVGAAVAAVLR